MTILFIAAVIALVVSLVTNARQFFAKLELLKYRDGLLARLTSGRSGRVQEVTEKQLWDFDSALQAYGVAVPDPRAIESIALRELAQDLRVLSSIASYAKAAGWAHAFSVVIGIRVRLIVSQFVIAHAPSGSEPMNQGIDQLLVLLRAWATLHGFYDDFTQPLAFKTPEEVARKAWQDLPAAESVAIETQNAAVALLALVEKARSAATPPR